MVKKILLAKDVSSLFINGKPAVINGLRNLKTWPIDFLVVSFNTIPLFAKHLITFIIYFISLSVRVIPEPLPDVNFLLSSFIPLLTFFS